jgi:hypothetical protein
MKPQVIPGLKRMCCKARIHKKIKVVGDVSLRYYYPVVCTLCPSTIENLIYGYLAMKISIDVFNSAAIVVMAVDYPTL